MQPTHVAIIQRHDRRAKKAIIVPRGQSLDFDEGRATRRWLHPHLGLDWHLVEFVEIACDPANITVAPRADGANEQITRGHTDE